jgi:hypothetical protein
LTRCCAPSVSYLDILPGTQTRGTDILRRDWVHIRTSARTFRVHRKMVWTILRYTR